MAKKKEMKKEFAGDHCSLKLLIPNEVIGSVIGKSGTVVSQMERVHGVKINISSFYDFYPGTQDRVCVVCGEKNNVLTVVELLIDLVGKMKTISPNIRRANQLRIPIPHLSVEKIIGFQGSTVRRLKSLTDTYIYTSQPPHNTDMYEQCLVITGDLENVKKAFKIILNIIENDTNVTFYQNLSYSGVSFPLAHAIPCVLEESNFAANENVRGASDDFFTQESQNLQSSRATDLLSELQTSLREVSYGDSKVSTSITIFKFLTRLGILDDCSTSLQSYFSGNSDTDESTSSQFRFDTSTHTSTRRISSSVDELSGINSASESLELSDANPRNTDVKSTSASHFDASAHTSVLPARETSLPAFSDDISWFEPWHSGARVQPYSSEGNWPLKRFASSVSRAFISDVTEALPSARNPASSMLGSATSCTFTTTDRTVDSCLLPSRYPASVCSASPTVTSKVSAAWPSSRNPASSLLGSATICTFTTTGRAVDSCPLPSRNSASVCSASPIVTSNVSAAWPSARNLASSMLGFATGCRFTTTDRNVDSCLLPSRNPASVCSASPTATSSVSAAGPSSRNPVSVCSASPTTTSNVNAVRPSSRNPASSMLESATSRTFSSNWDLDFPSSRNLASRNLESAADNSSTSDTYLPYWRSPATRPVQSADNRVFQNSRDIEFSACSVPNCVCSVLGDSYEED